MSYTFTEITNKLTNGNSAIRDHGLLRYGDKVYFTTVAGGYCYLVECDKQGNCRSLQLFENDYDPTFGEDDYHGTPAIEWIEEGRKILAVGGGHGQYTPMKWAVVNIETWSIEASGDFGSDKLTYPILVRTSDGKISLFIAYMDDNLGYRIIRWYEFDPSTNTWSSPVQVTTKESKIVYHLGWNVDNGRYLIGIPHPGTYGPFVVVQFDPSTKKFYDMAGNELSLPFDQTTLSAIAGDNSVIVNGYLYTVRPDYDNGILKLQKYDLQGNLVAEKELASAANGLNTAYFGSAYALLYYENQLLIAYRNNSNRFEIDIVDPDTLGLTKVYESTSSDIPLYPHEENNYGGAIVWYNVIDTSGQQDWNIEVSSDHVTHVVFIDPAPAPSPAPTVQPLYISIPIDTIIYILIAILMMGTAMAIVSLMTNLIGRISSTFGKTTRQKHL